MNAIGDCVASHDAELEGGFCGTLLAGHRTLRQRACRQIAAAWANVCAGTMGVNARDGRPVALDGDAVIDLAEFHGSVSAWLAEAGATLGAMHGVSTTSDKRHKNADDDACRKLIRVAWEINHGIGIGPVCAPPSPHGDALVARGPSANAVGADAFASTTDPEPLAAELIADASTTLSFGAIQPNPFRSRMTLAYSVSTTAAADVAIGVYDLNGRLVRELLHATVAPGEYVTTWDGLDQNGASVRGGLYFVLGRIGGERVQSRVTFVH